MIARPANGSDHWVVVDATGRVVAQGRKVLCDLVAAGRVIFIHQGDLFDAV